MNYTKRICFFVLCSIFEEISTARSIIDSSEKYDITDVLHDSVMDALMAGHLQSELFNSILYPQHYLYMDKNPVKSKRFSDFVCFSALVFIITDYSRSPVRWNISKNDTFVGFNHLKIFITGQVRMWQNFSTYTFFSGFLEIKNVSLHVRHLTNGDEDKNINTSVSFGFAGIWGDNTIIRDYAIEYKERQKMVYIINILLPKMIKKRITRNKNFSQSLRTSPSTQPHQKIISRYSDFHANKEKYYYLLLPITLEIISFSDIKIVGLSNFESTEVKEHPPNDSYLFTNKREEPKYYQILHMNDIYGSMDLRYGKEKLEFKKQIAAINFTINRLSMLVDPSNNFTTFEAKDYSISEFPQNFSISITNWLSKFSSTIMRHIESAMAHSIVQRGLRYQLNVQVKNASSLESSTRQMENSFIQKHGKIKSSYDT
ncbi:uncharacterized protein LOC135834909 isoform X1 [Planococcus citri]|uniref:uncharacterized protein LOC135834909 isoform X1 n=1 Tax=Planococcus citri TaxID=170843 RepID=UPI0031F80A70